MTYSNMVHRITIYVASLHVTTDCFNAYTPTLLTILLNKNNNNRKLAQ